MSPAGSMDKARGQGFNQKISGKSLFHFILSCRTCACVVTDCYQYCACLVLYRFMTVSVVGLLLLLSLQQQQQQQQQQLLLLLLLLKCRLLAVPVLIVSYSSVLPHQFARIQPMYSSAILLNTSK